MDHQTITKAIIRSQHCQRNWDLTQEMPEDDLNLIITAATQCPSKQNVAFYNLHVISNRSVIEQLHDQTRGFTIKYGSEIKETNSQILANLVLVFEESDHAVIRNDDHVFRNEQTFIMHKNQGAIPDYEKENIKRDKYMAAGVAAGYVNLTASLLGYATGCCVCFESQGITDVLGLKNPPLLIMGVGYKDPNLNRRVHHINHDFVFPTKTKEPIKVSFVK
jgi:hypothetical protein